MPKFSVHVALMSPEFRPVSFAPGDEVPDWADGQVGAHCLEPELEVEAADDHGDAEADGDAGPDPDPESDPESDADDEESEGEEPTAAAADVPDFTAPAPRRNSRTRR